MHACFNEFSCQFGTNSNGVEDRGRIECNVRDGYYGPLCGGCDMSGKNPNGVFVRSGFACAQCPDDATNWVVVGVLAAGTLAGLGYLVALHSFAALPGDFSAFGALPAFPTRACARHHLRLCSCFPLTGFASPSFSHRCYGSENAGVAHANARCAGHLQGQRNRDLQRMGGENKCHRRGVTYIHARREVFARVADLRPIHPEHGASASRNWHCRVVYDTNSGDRALCAT